jgi:HSP20 family protein
MKTEVLQNSLSNNRAPVIIDRLLVDTPLSGLLGNSLFSHFDNNMLETADGYRLEIAVPGMKRKDLKLEVANSILTVQGQKKQKAAYGWKSKTIEYRSAQFHKTIVLPWDADQDRIKAECQDGLLRISIPKLDSQQTACYIDVVPVEDAGRASWWQKVAAPFRKLKSKVKGLFAGMGIGSKRRRFLIS